jgi:glycosyltransferase involved in cell wall biosynthesis
VARLAEWTPERHREWTAAAGAALDIKGEDFRSRYKPPAKALDFVASGLPLAMNADASAVEYLANLGLAVPTPNDVERWRSQDYWQETQQAAKRLRDQLTLENVAQKLAAIIQGMLHEQAEFGDARRKAREDNDQAVELAVNGETESARSDLNRILETAPSYLLAEENLALLSANGKSDAQSAVSSNGAIKKRTKVALASFLFNWPSTGGGIVHTVELGKFLQAAGFEVHHFYARRLADGIGRVLDSLPYEDTAIEFADDEWNVVAIRERFRAAVSRFGPDRVIITDSWNTKPILADALKEWSYLLRFQALECLCPLNNIRLLPDPASGVRQCMTHQLASPDECRECVASLGNQAGSLHQIERHVAGYGTPEYDHTLRSALKNAHAVLVVNPLMEAMLSPYASRVVVCPAGMDPARFPTPASSLDRGDGVKRVLFAGLIDEFIKGYHVLRHAAWELWNRRQDFRIVATAEPPSNVFPFEEFIGWQQQLKLPAAMANAEIIAVPAVAQEAIGRTAVEGMAAGRPVLASRIGGLPFALGEGAAGLLFESGDPTDLAVQLEQLLDDEGLRYRLGAAGRKRFEERFSWPGIIERQYRPLLEVHAGEARKP